MLLEQEHPYSGRLSDNSNLKLRREKLRYFESKYPALKHCWKEPPYILQDGEYYYIELSDCIYTIIARDSEAKQALVPNRYFPNIGISTKPSYGSGKYRYQQYYGFFDTSNPFYDIISIGDVPYLLILNNAKGEKVNIPLISNSDVLETKEN